MPLSVASDDLPLSSVFSLNELLACLVCNTSLELHLFASGDCSPETQATPDASVWCAASAEEYVSDDQLESEEQLVGALPVLFEEAERRVLELMRMSMLPRFIQVRWLQLCVCAVNSLVSWSGGTTTTLVTASAVAM